jgi:hypothetical protein
MVPAGSGDDDQSLTERMAMPGAARAGLKPHQRPGEASRLVAAELPFDRDVAGEIFGGPFLR